jgi:hypothetical protein
MMIRFDGRSVRGDMRYSRSIGEPRRGFFKRFNRSYWRNGVMEEWSDGRVECWSIGVMDGQAEKTNKLVLLLEPIPPFLHYSILLLLHHSNIP